jgi:LPXTG-motif cell wall-anchored protein
MKKIMSLGSSIGALLLSLLLAGPAIAQVRYPPNPPEEPNVVRQGEGTGAAGADADLAFTGQDVTLLLLVIGALVVAGVAALVVARRRAAGATG